ncbi:hypothetical protein NMY22_g10278 [Coprinellus aureogranulatus]|nr:hypothetical protein NMY22_g10278 [Coprinellus aureogranulatus]
MRLTVRCRWWISAKGRREGWHSPREDDHIPSQYSSVVGISFVEGFEAGRDADERERYAWRRDCESNRKGDERERTPREVDYIPSQYPKGVSGVRRRRRLGDRCLVQVTTSLPNIPKGCKVLEGGVGTRSDATEAWGYAETVALSAIMGVLEPKATALIFAGLKIVIASAKPEDDSPLGLSNMHNIQRTRDDVKIPFRRNQRRVMGYLAIDELDLWFLLKQTALRSRISFSVGVEGFGMISTDLPWQAYAQCEALALAKMANETDAHRSLGLVYHVGRRARANLAIGLKGIAKVLQHRRSVNGGGAVYEVLNWIASTPFSTGVGTAEWWLTGTFNPWGRLAAPASTRGRRQHFGFANYHNRLGSFQNASRQILTGERRWKLKLRKREGEESAVTDAAHSGRKDAGRAVDVLAVCDSEETEKVKHDVGKGREYTLSVGFSERGEECMRAKAKGGKGGKGEANPDLRPGTTRAAGGATMLHRQPSLPIQNEIQALDPAGKAAVNAIRAAKASD